MAENFAVNFKFPKEVLNILKGMRQRVEVTQEGINVSFESVISNKAKPFTELLKPYFKEGYYAIPERYGWFCDPNGNQAEAVPLREENGEHWIDQVKILTDTDTDYLGAELPDGTIIKKIIQAPKWVEVGYEVSEVFTDYLKSDKYRQVIKDEVFLVTHNLSMDGDKVQSIESKASQPIVSKKYNNAMDLATKVGYGNIESELLHDVEYSFWWIYQKYVKKDEKALKHWHWLWLQTINNKSSSQVVVRGVCSISKEVGSRAWNFYGNDSSSFTFRSSLKRSAKTLND